MTGLGGRAERAPDGAATPKLDALERQAEAARRAIAASPAWLRDTAVPPLSPSGGSRSGESAASGAREAIRAAVFDSSGQPAIAPCSGKDTE